MYPTHTCSLHVQYVCVPVHTGGRSVNVGTVICMYSTHTGCRWANVRISLIQPLHFYKNVHLYFTVVRFSAIQSR